MSTFAVSYSNATTGTKSYATNSRAYSKILRPGDRILQVNKEGLVTHEAVLAETNTHLPGVLFLAFEAVYPVTPYPPPVRLCFPINRVEERT
jgi:hypothetical protein